MNDSLLGVLIGGILGISGSLLATYFQIRQSNKRDQIDYFEKRKLVIKELMKKLPEKILENYNNKTVDIDFFADMAYNFSKKLFMKYDEFVTKENKTKSYVVEFNSQMILLMKDELNNIEKRIINILKLKHPNKML